MSKIALTLLSICISALCIAQSAPEFTLLQPTGRTTDSLPEMRLPADSTGEVKNLVQTSFLGDMLDFYGYCQSYLLHSGEIDSIEPGYLALTKNQGGFARKGFALLLNGTTTPMPDAQYVDMVENSVQGNPARLSSITQIYPHELGHIIYRKLSLDPSEKELNRASSIHYFSVMTDYSTAFNEGFAEHIENIARLHEPDPKIRAGIEADTKRLGKNLPQKIAGYEKDLAFPLRLGLYQTSMLAWYQQLEDWRRYQQALGATPIRYKNTVLPKGSPQERLRYRNAGVGFQNGVARNQVQMLLTEGFVCAFFTRLEESSLNNIPLPDSLLRLVFPEGSPALLPWQNQLLKNCIVIHRYVRFSDQNRIPMADFIKGYCALFPREAAGLLRIFRETAGYEFNPDMPPPLWMMVKGFDHALLALDAFGAITIPIYTFDLNAAELEDLATVPGLPPEMARLLLDYRSAHGWFYSLDDALKIPGLSEEARQALRNNTFDQAHYDALPEPKLTITALITTPLLHLWAKATLWFLLFAAIVYAGWFRKNSAGWKGPTRFFTIHYFRWLLWVLLALAGVLALQQPILAVLAPALVFLLVDGWTQRKNRLLFWRAAMITCIQGAVIAGALS